MARGRPSLRGKVVVVTGAAHGIGRATSLNLAALGARVAGCDVDQAALTETLRECQARGAEATLGGHVDVGDADAVQAFAVSVDAELGPAFGLVNNAGVGVAGGFFATTPADWEWLLRVNLWGVIHATRAFGEPMARRGAGRIVNVASASGFCNLPSLSAYGTTKYAVVGLSEALRAELLPRGVTVSVVCPGLVATSMVGSARVRGVPDELATRSALEALYRRRGHPPETVAQAIVDTLGTGRALVPVTPEAWLLYALKRLAPSTLPLVLRASAHFYKR